MKYIKLNYFITCLIFLSFHSFAQPSLSLKYSSLTYVKSNLEFLASDELEGREATSHGAKIASLFISEELEKYGVIPFGDSGTYFQNFNIYVSGYKEGSKIHFVKPMGQIIDYDNGNNVVYSSRNLPNNKYSNIEYEVVFVGYGVYSEEDNYNSYQDIDVNGKVVLFINGTPKVDGKQILNKEAQNKFRRTTGKLEIAKSKGAVGAIVLPDEETIKYWKFIENWANSKSFKLEDEVDTTKSKNNIPLVMLNKISSEELLNNEEIDFHTLTESIDPNPTPFILSTKVKFNFDLTIEKRKARNVVGLIKGNNENLSKEYITLGAHYDHLGIKGNEVFNGADDNASGTVTILETARKIAFNGSNERPVVVIFHTAEEEGLKGAKYFTNHSEIIKDAVVHINIDMVGRKNEDSIYCIGASKISSELGRIVEEVNKKTTDFVFDYKFDDTSDPQRLYYRSDHVHYARKGIPIVFFYDYMKTDYHKSSDTVDKINFSKIVKMTDYIYSLAMHISNLDHKLSKDK